MNDIIKIIKSPEENSLLIIGVSEAGKSTIRAGEGIIKVGQNATSFFNKFWNTKVLSRWT